MIRELNMKARISCETNDETDVMNIEAADATYSSQRETIRINREEAKALRTWIDEWLNAPVVEEQTTLDLVVKEEARCLAEMRQ